MDTPASQSAAFIPPLQDFVEMRISAREFHTRFLELLNKQQGSVDPRVRDPLHFLFCEVDNFAYRNLQDPNSPNGIDEHSFRTSAREALSTLLGLQQGRSRSKE